MHIILIGSGNMGAGLAARFAGAGHQVTILSRDRDKAAALAGRTGSRLWDSAADAGPGDLVVVATAYDDAVTALRQLGDLSGRTIIDITNPLTPDFAGLSIGHTTSAAEEIAGAFPAAQVVKAFNTVFAQVLQEGPDFGAGRVVPVFYAGDSEAAKDSVKALIESTGFAPVDAGPLKNARYLEPLAALNIYLGYGAGHGTAIAPAWIERTSA